MNSSVYTFGSLSRGYTQYPYDESSAAVFQRLAAMSDATTQLVIHREGDLMYYAYVRNLETGKYLGLCVMLNGMMITVFREMFALFENAISNLVYNGHLIKYDERGWIVPNTEKLYLDKDVLAQVEKILKDGFNQFQTSSLPLPPVNYASGNYSSAVFSIENADSDILQSSYNNAYTCIYKSKDYNTQQMDSFQGILSRISDERDALKSECDNLEAQLKKVNAQKQNLMWVSLLGAIVLILGVILWNKVLFPSEVTHKEMKDFVYYGPLNNGKPHGTGVAIYPANDPDERKYYIGNFVEGNRQDTAAILFYQNGNYYYGSMEGDNWKKGLVFHYTKKQHFEGTYKENKPYDGFWYEHKKICRVKNGREVSL